MKPSKEFEEAARAKVRAEELLERRRTDLAPMIAAEVARGVNLSTVGKLAGYTPEHVRRIARAHGVEKTVDREPPKRRGIVIAPSGFTEDATASTDAEHSDSH